METIVDKLARLYAALSVRKVYSLELVEPIFFADRLAQFVGADFTKAIPEAELRNETFQLIALIGSLKDHLHEWCKANSRPFEGDALINSNQSVALIHDLWNIDKHSKLSKPPRSGIHPRLEGLRTTLILQSANKAGSAIKVTLDPSSGRFKTHAPEGGTAKIGIVADIVDERGNKVCAFWPTVEAAVSAWEFTAQKAGVVLLK